MVRPAEGVVVFVQVIQGQVTDAGKVRAALDRWAQELAPGATGWLGSTAGVTEDGRFIALARFESEQAARRNSDRPEQDRWWAETSKLFTGEASFKDSVDVLIGSTYYAKNQIPGPRPEFAVGAGAGTHGSGLGGVGCLPSRCRRQCGGGS